MQRRVTALFLTILLVLSLTACGSTGPEKEPVPAAEATGTPTPVPAATAAALPGAGELLSNLIGSYSGSDGSFRETKLQAALTGSSGFISEGISSVMTAEYTHRVDTSDGHYIFMGAMTEKYTDDGIDMTSTEREEIYSGDEGTFYKMFYGGDDYDWVEKTYTQPLERTGFRERAEEFVKGSAWLDGKVSDHGTGYMISGTAGASDIAGLAGTVSERASNRVAGIIGRMSGEYEGELSFSYELVLSKKSYDLTSLKFTVQPVPEVQELGILVTFASFTGELEIPEGLAGISEAEADAYVNGDPNYDYSGASEWTTDDSELSIRGMHFTMPAREGYFYLPAENRFSLEIGRTVTDYDYNVRYYDPILELTAPEEEVYESLTSEGRYDTVHRTDTRYGHILWVLTGENDGGTFVTAYEYIDGLFYYIAYNVGCYVPCDDIGEMAAQFSMSRLCMEQN